MTNIFEPGENLQACYDDSVESIVEGTLNINGSDGNPVTLGSTLENSAF